MPTYLIRACVALNKNGSQCGNSVNCQWHRCLDAKCPRSKKPHISHDIPVLEKRKRQRWYMTRAQLKELVAGQEDGGRSEAATTTSSKVAEPGSISSQRSPSKTATASTQTQTNVSNRRISAKGHTRKQRPAVYSVPASPSRQNSFPSSAAPPSSNEAAANTALRSSLNRDTSNRAEQRESSRAEREKEKETEKATSKAVGSREKEETVTITRRLTGLRAQSYSESTHIRTQTLGSTSYPPSPTRPGSTSSCHPSASRKLHQNTIISPNIVTQVINQLPFQSAPVVSTTHQAAASSSSSTQATLPNSQTPPHLTTSSTKSSDRDGSKVSRPPRSRSSSPIYKRNTNKSAASKPTSKTPHTVFPSRQHPHDYPRIQVEVDGGPPLRFQLEKFSFRSVEGERYGDKAALSGAEDDTAGNVEESEEEEEDDIEEEEEEVEGEGEEEVEAEVEIEATRQPVRRSARGKQPAVTRKRIVPLIQTSARRANISPVLPTTKSPDERPTMNHYRPAILSNKTPIAPLRPSTRKSCMAVLENIEEIIRRQFREGGEWNSEIWLEADKIGKFIRWEEGGDGDGGGGGGGGGGGESEDILAYYCN